MPQFVTSFLVDPLARHNDARNEWKHMIVYIRVKGAFCVFSIPFIHKLRKDNTWLHLLSISLCTDHSVHHVKIPCIKVFRNHIYLNVKQQIFFWGGELIS